MIPIMTRMFKDKLKPFLVYVISAIGLLEMYIALYPTIREQVKDIDALIKAFPPEFFKALNMDPGGFSFATMESYMSTEYMSFLWPILAIILAISLASYICIRDIDSGTIESIAALPVSRTKLFVARYLTGIKMLAVFVIVSFMMVIPLSAMHGVDVVTKNYIVATIGSFFFVWFIYSVATFFSTIFSEKGKSNMAIGGLIVFMYVLNIVAGLTDKLSGLKYFSVFYYFSGTELLNKAELTSYSLIVLGGVAILASVFALIRFNRRDLSV